MKLLFLAFSALVALTTAVSDSDWNNWKASMAKSYSDAAAEQRARSNYDANDQIIQANNAKFASGQVSFEMGHNRFSDLSSNDFAALLQDTIPNQVTPLSFVPFPGVPSGWTPTSIDLKETTKLPVEDQGDKCASGWAFAGTALFEYWLVKRQNQLLDLSEQNAVDCARKDGCKGGWVEDVATYYEKNGMNWKSKYADGVFAGTDNNCRYVNTLKNQDSGVSYYFQPKDYYFVEGHDTSIQYALHQFGWTTVCLDARQWQFYKGGVMSAADCGEVDNQKPNHCVVIVGYGEENGAKYWTVRNSFSTKWGENGHIRLERGANTCGILEKYSSRICTY